MSPWCGPSVEPQQTCMRMRSAGRSFTAWLSASTFIAMILR